MSVKRKATERPRGHIYEAIVSSDMYLSKNWWTPSQMAKEIGEDSNSLKSAVSTLINEGSVESNSNGCYRRNSFISTSRMPIRTRRFDFEKNPLYR